MNQRGEVFALRLLEFSTSRAREVKPGAGKSKSLRVKANDYYTLSEAAVDAYFVHGRAANLSGSPH